ncbi:hypothetical protein J1605_005378 [Eschrichtius robustus]|uniref:Uncharacterized protein n=1 Tax=Eschrichtius robustus TaxID=9764 RepID=A0AB34HBS9_ESCRO|nr:hypothetical protein J1605_005378 [Eschrichtius robustus]
MGMSSTSSAEQNAQGELKRSGFQPARPNHYEACRNQKDARRVSDITCDAWSFSHVPSPPHPGRPLQKRTRTSASALLATHNAPQHRTVAKAAFRRRVSE